ncbi:L-2-amino-thiazoline-4-carboxylic acid hydrolase [Thermodesulfobacteriota bacterium]
MENFYTSNRNRLLTAFEKIRRAAVDYISKQSTSEAANHIGNEAALNFEKILPELPYVGGDVHPGTRFIVNAGQWIALYKSMIKRDYKALEVAQMMYSIYEDQLEEVPSDELEKQKVLTSSDEYINLMKQWAESTSPYECDWKADFIEGDGVDFDYGLDYRTCPCFELFKDQDAEQLAPFFCLLDFPEARQLDSGFFRTKTLAQGNDICNFRYKKGKEVAQNWDTELEKILTSAHA